MAAGLRGGFPKRANATTSFDAAVQTVRQLRAAGVPLLAGTDAPNPGTGHGASLHRELELMVRAGLTPTEALRSATSVSARAFALGDRGRIAPGLRADLVLVNGDPTTDITRTRDIVGVWKRGVAVDRQAAAAAVAKAKREAETGAAVPVGLDDGVVSDFDDGSTKSMFGAGWMVSTDAMAGGKSTATMNVVSGGASGSAGALAVSGDVGAGLPYAWSGVMFSPGTAVFQPANVSSRKVISFWTRGDGQTYRVMVFSQSRGQMPIQQTFTAPAEWTQVSIPFAKFDGIDGKDLMAVVFAAGPKPGAFSFQIDAVRFY
jgi:hypothetical protein